MLGVTRLLTLYLPFSVVRRLLGDHHHPIDLEPASGPEPADADPGHLRRARRIGWIVQTAATRTPWTSDCYPQALAARVLLRAARVPHRVTFGVRRDDAGELRAHAWVSTGRVTVTGGTGQPWTGVGSFAWTPRSR